jgi:hypothetical protein
MEMTKLPYLRTMFAWQAFCLASRSPRWAKLAPPRDRFPKWLGPKVGNSR